mgnify:FL=1
MRQNAYQLSNAILILEERIRIALHPLATQYSLVLDIALRFSGTTSVVSCIFIDKHAPSLTPKLEFNKSSFEQEINKVKQNKNMHIDNFPKRKKIQ